MSGDGESRGRVLGLEQWQLNQYVVVLAVFLAFMGITFVNPFLPLYVQQLGVDDLSEAALWSGLALGIAPLLSGITSPLWGALADRFGLKLIFERSLFSFTLIFIGYTLIGNVYQLVGLRVAWGIMGGFTAISTAMVTLCGPREQMSRGLGLLQAGQLVGFALGPVFGGVLADNVGLRQSFYAPAVATFCALLLTHFVYRDLPADTAAQRREGRSLLRDLFALPQFLPIVAVLFFAQFVDKSFTVSIPLFIATVEQTTKGIATLAGVIISSGALAAALSAWLIGRIATKHSPWHLLLMSLIAGLIVSAVMVLASDTWQLMALRILVGLLAGGTITLAYTVGGLALPPHGRAAAVGLLASAALFGSASSPIVTGALTGLSIHGSFAANALAYGLALAAFSVAVTRLSRQRRAEPRVPSPFGKGED